MPIQRFSGLRLRRWTSILLAVAWSAGCQEWLGWRAVSRKDTDPVGDNRQDRDPPTRWRQFAQGSRARKSPAYWRAPW
jgi:hypothetical protein